MKLLNSIRVRYRSLLGRSAGVEGDMADIEYWQNRIYNLLSVLLLYLGGPILLYGGYLFIRTTEYFFMGIFEASLYGVIVLVHNLKALSLPAKKFINILILYVLSILLLIFTGKDGAGMVSVIFCFILSVSMLDRRQNYTFYVINLLVFAILTVLLFLGAFQGLPIESYGKNWLINMISVQFFCLILFLLFGLIFKGLETQTRKMKESNQLLAASEEKYRLLADNAADLIWIYNVNQGRYLYFSPSVYQIRGYTVEEALSMSLEESLSADSYELFKERLPERLTITRYTPDPERTFITEMQLRCKDGTNVWVENSVRYYLNGKEEVEIVGVSRDITERKKKEEEIRFLNQHDTLTGLLNRNALKELSQKEAGLRDLGSRSVLFINIDKFRVINEALGVHGGDRILADIARKIDACVGEEGRTYRYGSDEFLVIIRSADADRSRAMALEIKRAIAQRIHIADRDFYLTASIGLCTGGGNETTEQIVIKAGTALFLAKKEQDRIIAYSPEMELARTRETILEEDLQEAVEKGQLLLHYQPVVDIVRGTISHAEALIRWNHPGFGLVSPGEFIPIAERTKLIIPITQWVIEKTCATMAEWKNRGIEDFIVSINLSQVCFENRHRELGEQLKQTVSRVGISPSNLKLELTESSLIKEPEEAMMVFQELKDSGFKLALDDFGTGYSSFAYLKDLPLNIIKLDRGLLDGIETDRKVQMILQSMISIAHSLDLEVVAEGVETTGQLSFLDKAGCDLIQGFLFSRPVDADAFLKYYLSMKEPGSVLSGLKTMNHQPNERMEQ